MTTRRPALGISGWLLFVCLFLPTLEVCGTPTMPAEFPPFYVFYVGSAIVGIIAWTRRGRLRGRLLTLLAAIWAVSLLVLPVAFLGHEAPVLAVLLVVLAAVALWMFVRWSWRLAYGGQAVMAGVLVHAALCVGWTALLATDRDALWGAHVALAGASTMLTASAIAWVDERRQRLARDREAFPEARVVL